VDQDSIRDLFTAFGPVTVRRMFGGMGIYAGETMFALVAGGVIYLKTTELNKADFEREALEPFSFNARGKRMVTSYRRMPDRLYDDPDELAVWATRALTAAQEKRSGKSKRKKS
jgi:DNA transformation protein